MWSMDCVLELCFLLCTIPLIKPTSIKIDGQINFGDKWNYEYRIYTTEANGLRMGKITEKVKKHETAAEQMKKLRDLLLTAQERFQKVSSELREVETEDDLAIKKHDLKKGDKYPLDSSIHNIDKPKNIELNKIFNTAEDNNEASDDTDSYSDSDNASNSKEHEETTKKPRKLLRINSEDSNYNPREKGEIKHKKTKKGHKNLATSSYESVLDVLDLNVNPLKPKPENYIRDSKGTKIISKFLKKTHEFNKESEVPQKLTTIRTEAIYNKTFVVKDDEKITNFINYLYNETIRAFNVVKQRTNHESVKKIIDELEKSYTVKFKEFLLETGKKIIKTRLGTQKVILNTIDTSTAFLNRLANLLADDVSKGNLRDTVRTITTFKKVIDKAEKLELKHACETFGICRPNSLFSIFITKVLDTLLLYDETKFTETRDALTEELKLVDFSVLNQKAQKKLKRKIDSFERMEVGKAKVMVAILKNTIVNRNKPIAVNPLRSRLVNSTLALFEIIDLLDTKIVGNDTNAAKWVEFEYSFQVFGERKTNNVKIIISDLIKYFKKSVASLDHASQKILLKHFVTMLHLS